MPEQLADRLAADYLAAEPNRGSSRTIVRALSLKHGLSESKARGLLVRAGVYRAMPRDKSHVASADREAMFAFFDRKGAGGDIIRQAADSFGYTQGAVLKFRMACDLPVLNLREVSFRQAQRTLADRRRPHQRKPTEIAAEPEPQMLTGGAELDPELLMTSEETGFFSQPFWPLQLILLVLLSTLVAFVIKSAVGE
jgi:hypothetical protein